MQEAELRVCLGVEFPLSLQPLLHSLCNPGRDFLGETGGMQTQQQPQPMETGLFPPLSLSHAHTHVCIPAYKYTHSHTPHYARYTPYTPTILSSRSRRRTDCSCDSSDSAARSRSCTSHYRQKRAGGGIRDTSSKCIRSHVLLLHAFTKFPYPSRYATFAPSPS